MSLILIHINERTSLPIFGKCGTPAEQYFFNWTLSTCTHQCPVVHLTVDLSSRIYNFCHIHLDLSTYYTLGPYEQRTRPLFVKNFVHLRSSTGD